jgi:hypothetical protein
MLLPLNDVIQDAWVRAELGMEWLRFARSNQFGDLAVGIVLAAKDASTQHAGFNTGGDPTVLNPVQAQPALVYHTSFFVKRAGLVGTGQFAVLATNTQLLIDHHHAIVAVIGGLGGAHLLTRGIGAVLALDGEEPGGKSLILGQDMYIATILTQVVVNGAGFLAGTAANALGRVNHKRI